MQQQELRNEEFLMFIEKTCIRLACAIHFNLYVRERKQVPKTNEANYHYQNTILK